MTRKTHLKGEVDSPSGHAPAAAWHSVQNQVQRPEDLWLAGNPLTLLDDGFESWRSRLAQRLTPPGGPFGLRLRFVFDDSHQGGAVDLASLVSAVLRALPGLTDQLFLHAELMRGPEEGVYLAFENRPPALLTQVYFQPGEKPQGSFIPASAPLHLSILLHDLSVSFEGAWSPEVWKSLLQSVADFRGGVLEPAEIHQLSLARSDAHASGVSIGIEGIRQEQGSRGGFSAAEEGSRTPSRRRQLG